MRLKTQTRISPGVMLPMLLCALLLPAIPGTAYAEDSAPLRLTLPQAIDLALKQNRTLKLAQLAVVDSGHKKEIARSAYFPHIKNESAVLHLTELAGVEFPTGAFGTPSATGPIPGHNVVVDQGSLTTYTSGTGLEQPITQMFKIHASNLAATADINTARIQLDQAQDEVALTPDNVYVIPPDALLSVQGYTLRVKKAPPDRRMPIDHFFSSLAAEISGKIRPDA